MQIKKGIMLTTLTLMLCASGPVVYAQTNTQALQNIQQQIQQKAQEKQSVNSEIQNIQQEIASLNTYVAQNQAALAETKQKMAVTNQLIEQKKEEIVTLENNIFARRDVMKNRLVALQHDGNSLSVMLQVLLDAKNLDDFIERATAVTSLFNADNDILTAQQHDLSQIEADKKVIDQQEQVLENEQNTLANQQAQLQSNLQKRQQTLTGLQSQLNKIAQDMAMAQQEKGSIEAQIKAAQEKLLQEQAAARARAAAAANSSSSSSGSSNSSSPGQAPGQGVAMYVTATAYSPQDSGSITNLGYNIQANPNIKLIAVDPSVIPLGKKVWVEGYGVAIAGDTGGAIVGYRIDVLMPTRAQALAFGRKTLKVIVLN